jgi:hypothetical protein
MKQSRAKRIVERLLMQDRIKTRVVELRSEAGIRAHGFKDKQAYDIFHRSISLKPQLDDLFTAERKFKEFAGEVLKEMGIPIGYSGLHAVLHEYFLYGKVSDEAIEQSDTTGCTLEKLHSDDPPEKRLGLEPGVYIRLGADTDITALQEFVQRRADTIRIYQDGKRKHLRPLTSSFPDLFRKYLKLSKNELQEMTESPSPYIEDLISEAIKLIDGKKITPESVKTGIKRMRKRERGDR